MPNLGGRTFRLKAVEVYLTGWLAPTYIAVNDRHSDTWTICVGASRQLEGPSLERKLAILSS